MEFTQRHAGAPGGELLEEDLEIPVQALDGRGDGAGPEQVGALWKAAIVRSAAAARRSPFPAPVDARRHRAVHPIAVLEQHGRVTAVEAESAGFMAHRRFPEALPQQLRHEPDL